MKNPYFYSAYRGKGWLLSERIRRFMKGEPWSIWHDLTIVIISGIIGIGITVLFFISMKGNL